MISLHKFSLSAMVVAASYAIAQPALACSWQPPLDFSGAAVADLVFAGHFETLEVTRLDNNPGVVTSAIATFTVTEAIKGEVPDRIEVLILDHLVGVPETWRWDADVIIATTQPGTSDSAWSGYHNPRPDLPVLLTPTCGTPFIAPDTAESRAEIAAALALHGDLSIRP